jgi:2-oxoglutarate dehydrogenase E2 component (dihydrolipoamide succinyltransferase)
MPTEIRVPTLGESIAEATVGQWFKKVGDTVKADEPLVELETEKVTVEVPAPAAGVIEAIAVRDGETVGVGALLGTIATNGAGARPTREAPAREAPARAAPVRPADLEEEAAAARATPAPAGRPNQKTGTTRPIGAGPEQPALREALSPAVRKLLAENELEPSSIPATGKGGRLTKGDVLAALEVGGAAPRQAEAPPRSEAPAPAAVRPPAPPSDEAREERVRMTRLRQTIARRLKDAQNTAAMLTTFNEVDMSAVMKLRARYKDVFEKKHGVKLGFMGFFVRSTIQALKDIPAVNAEIDGQDIVYKNYYHIGVAVGTDRGLVVPVVRDADMLSLAEIEKRIGELGRKARDGQLSIEDMQGGTFTISNGGVYGSLMSTPILNAPQSGILGMHKIEDRPVAVDGRVEIRPMMYLALTYDHRVVDGKEAVTFLVRIKETVEDPERLMLDL